MPAKALKAADKQSILKKLVVELKRRYGSALPKEVRPTLETLLFAICLEDSPYSSAETAYSQLLDSFFDLNEIRVSSVNEIMGALGDLNDADWKALRIREALQFVFEKHYAFDLEPLRRKTQDVALKELAEIPHQTPFARMYTVQHGLGAHVVPLDRSMYEALVWLGLADAETGLEAASEDLRSAVKKAEGPLICHLLKGLAIDPELRHAFAGGKTGKEPPDPFEAPRRLVDLFRNPRKAKKPAAKPAKVAKEVSLKRPDKKAPARNSSSDRSVKKGVKKVTKKRPELKKTNRPRPK